jgi:xylulokinase
VVAGTVVSTRKLLAAAPAGAAAEVAAIGISGHSLGVVPVDAEGRLLRQTVPIWSDARPDTQPAAFFDRVPETCGTSRRATASRRLSTPCSS